MLRDLPATPHNSIMIKGDRYSISPMSFMTATYKHGSYTARLCDASFSE